MIKVLLILFVLMFSNEVYASPNLTGSGTAIDPYKIYTPADMFEINNDPSAYYQLQNDIDFYTVEGTYDNFYITTLSGIIDGSGYSIKNRKSNNNKPLIETMYNGEIHNLGIENEQIEFTTGKQSYLVGTIRGNENKFVNSFIRGSSVTWGPNCLFGSIAFNYRYSLSGHKLTFDRVYFEGNTFIHNSTTLSGSIIINNDIQAIEFRDCYFLNNYYSEQTTVANGLTYRDTMTFTRCYFAGEILYNPNFTKNWHTRSNTYTNCYQEETIPNSITRPGLNLVSNHDLKYGEPGETIFTNWSLATWVFIAGNYPMLYYQEIAFVPGVIENVFVDPGIISANITWSYSENAQSYNIYIDDVFVKNTTGLSTTITNLIPNKYYIVSVCGVIGSNEGLKKYAGFKTDFGPSSPTGFKVEDKSFTWVSLSWNHDPKADGYKIYVNDVFKAKVTSNSYVCGGLSPGNIYTIGITSTLGNWESSKNNITARTIDGSETLPAPENILLFDKGTYYLEIVWSSVENADGYRIYIDDVPYEVIMNRIKFTDLRPNTDYRIRVQAYRNIIGQKFYGDLSSTNIFSTEETPPGVTFVWLEEKNEEKYSAIISWDDIPEAQIYRIYVNNKLFKELGAGITSYELEDLIPGKRYRVYLTIRSQDIYEGERSNEIEIYFERNIKGALKGQAGVLKAFFGNEIFFIIFGVVAFITCCGFGVIYLFE